MPPFPSGIKLHDEFLTNERFDAVFPKHKGPKGPKRGRVVGSSRSADGRLVVELPSWKRPHIVDERLVDVVHE